MQHSIFEPLCAASAASNMEAQLCHSQALASLQVLAALTTNGFSSTTCKQLNLISSSGSNNSELALSNSKLDNKHVQLYDGDDDDGSVASKLQASMIMTKTMPSPSSSLPSSKEPSRESPYQKRLRVHKMKLQHCAEELGAESGDSPLYCGYGSDKNMYVNEKLDSDVAINSITSITQSNADQYIRHSNRVHSAPKYPCHKPLTKHIPQPKKFMKSQSFPPPLSHILPASNSTESFSHSLCAHREGGRLILRRVQVPSKHFLQASRNDGRLTLRVVIREDDETEEGKLGDVDEEGSSKVLQVSDFEEGMLTATQSLYHDGGASLKSIDNASSAIATMSSKGHEHTHIKELSLQSTFMSDKPTHDAALYPQESKSLSVARAGSADPSVVESTRELREDGSNQDAGERELVRSLSYCEKGPVSEQELASFDNNIDVGQSHDWSAQTSIQWKEWLESLHCKELFDREYRIGKPTSFIKLRSCIATRS